MTSVIPKICLGDLVYYIGPPIVTPLKWELIVENDNGIINRQDIGIVIDCDNFLHVADIFFQKNEITIERVSFRQLEIISQ